MLSETVRPHSHLVTPSCKHRVLTALPVILNVLRNTTRGEVGTPCPPARLNRNHTKLYYQWKVLVLDESSRRLLENIIKEDDILNENITSTLATTSTNLVPQSPNITTI